MVTKNAALVKYEWYDCDACDDGFEASTPPEPGRKLYEIHGCFKGKRKAQLDAITCKHCAALTGGSRCGCPEAIAQLKADADAADKKNKEDNARFALSHARFEKERADKLRKENERIDQDFRAMAAEGRKARQRDQLDLELRDREQAIKGRELTRIERRHDNFDAAVEADESAQVEGGEPLTAFEAPMDGSDLALAPTAMLERKDGATLFYDATLNFCFGTPGGGKSWLALHCIHETLLRGRRAIYWDHEDTPGTLSRRSLKLGLDLADFWRDGEFKYLRAGMEGSTKEQSTAMGEALAWVSVSEGSALVVIDSAESAGCPADGSDVAPWLAKMVQPFLDAGATVLVLDHVPKRKEGRPLGPIGSQHKLARVNGSALFISGIPWTGKADGHLVLTNHKDRHGQLPAPIGKAVARVIGTHNGESLHISIITPENEDNIEEAYIPTLQALADAGPDGIQGQKAMRDLVVGRNNQRDKAIGDLIGMGFILKRKPERSGQKVHYSITALGLEELGDSEDVEE